MMSECPPVLLLLFNRPDATRRVLERLRTIKPTQLLVAADGPRTGHSDDIESCAAVRSVITQGVDWNTQKMEVNFAPANMGLRFRVSSAIDWAFNHTDRLIILEDDCLPSRSFFEFCGELLDRYADDEEVGSVCGCNFQRQPFQSHHSYYFSRYSHCWGWATWKRAWSGYDVDMSDWPARKESGWLEGIFPHPLEAGYWRKIFDDTYHRKINTWDYQWVYHCWNNQRLAAIPAVNLVTNIGTGSSATNTRDPEEGKHHLPAGELNAPFLHPHEVTRNAEADSYSQKFVFGWAKDMSPTGRLLRLLRKARRCFRRQ
jgi:hypothetical protein